MMFAIVALAFAGILFTSIMEFVVSQVRYGSEVAAREESLRIAEAGVGFYRWYLYHNLETKTAMQIADFWKNGNPIAVNTPDCGQSGAYEVEYKDPGGAAVGKYCLEVTPSPAWSTVVMVKSVGWTYRFPDKKRTLNVRLRRPAWSEYMVLTNGMFRLSDRTEIYGKMHSNTGVHFDGVIHNLISSELSQYYDEDYNRTKPGVWTVWSNEYNTDLDSKVFLFGKQYPSSHVDFNSVVGNAGLMKQDAQAGKGRYFDGSGYGRRIILKTNDTYDICIVNTYDSDTKNISKYKRPTGSQTCNSCSGSCLQNFPIVDDGVIYVNDNVWLEGQINGKRLSVVAYDDVAGGKNVYLYNDLKYTNYDGTDVIGVLAQNDIEIIRDSDTHLQLDGAFVAKGGRLGRDDYGNVKSDITINGSIASNGRINFGRTDGTGYTDRYLYFDNDLTIYPPPYFPTGSDILVDLWEEL